MTVVNPPSAERLSRLEGNSGEFPFYNGTSVCLTGRQWLFVMAAVVVAFLVLALPIDWPGGFFGPFTPALLFPAIPLAALAYVIPAHWGLIFGKVGGRQVRRVNIIWRCFAVAHSRICWMFARHSKLTATSVARRG